MSSVEQVLVVPPVPSLKGPDWRTQTLHDNERSFRDMIMYPSLNSVFSMLTQLNHRKPGDLCFVVGPGGSGKTNLWRALPYELFGAPDGWGNQIPSVSVSAMNPDNGYFSPLHLVRSILQQLLDPFSTTDLPLRQGDAGLNEELKRAMSSLARDRKSATSAWLAVESIGRQVKLRHILIDEANLMMLTKRNRVPSDYIETLRSAALRIGCSVVMFGTFELTRVMNFSAQSNRRTLNLQIERFQTRTAKERGTFLFFLEAVFKDLGIDQAIVEAHAEPMYESSYGIAGEVVEQLQRAQLLATVDGDAVTWTHIERARQLPDALARLRHEADRIDCAFARDYAGAERAKAPKAPKSLASARKPGSLKATRAVLGAAA